MSAPKPDKSLLVACQVCQAQPGAPCVSIVRRQLLGNHSIRRADALHDFPEQREAPVRRGRRRLAAA